MAYQTEWRPHQAEASREEAERRALRWGEAPHGFLYRFEDVSYSYMNEWEEVSSRAVVELQAIPIRSITEHGYTIKASNANGWRFINASSRKQYACRTVELALASFIARKEKQAAIYEARAQRVRHYIKLAKGSML